MKKFLSLAAAALSLSVTAHASESMDAATFGLDTNSRPQYLREYIDTAYNIVAGDTANWVTNGVTHYNLLNIDEHILILNYIDARLLQGQKEFWFLDIGAGDYQWGEYLATWINSRDDYPDNITFNMCSSIFSRL